MQSFLKLLRESEGAGPPVEDLVRLGVSLCRRMQNDLAQAQPLVTAVLQSQLRMYLLDNKDVALVCARVLAQQEQHQAACRLLEGCCVQGGSQELVQVWNDIHYHLDSKRQGVPKLTSLQKSRCRKRNPPPPSLCPEGLKSCKFPSEVRQKLQNFASTVTIKPNKAEQEALAAQTGLTTRQVYKWFENYRKRTRPKAPSGHQQLGFVGGHPPEWTGGEGNGSEWTVVPTQGVWQPLTLASEVSGDKTVPESLTPKYCHSHGLFAWLSSPPPLSRRPGGESLQGCQMYPEGPGHDPSTVPAVYPDTGLSGLAGHSDLLHPLAAPKPWLVPLTLESPWDASAQTGQLVPSHGMNFSMPPSDASMSVSIAKLARASSTDESTPLDHEFLHKRLQPWEAQGRAGGFPDQTGSHPQITFLEEGLGTSVSQAGQPGSFLVSQPQPQAPECVPPPSFPELAPAPSNFPGPVPAGELSEPLLTSQVPWSDSQTSSDDFWVVRMNLELMEGNLG